MIPRQMNRLMVEAVGLIHHTNLILVMDWRQSDGKVMTSDGKVMKPAPVTEVMEVMAIFNLFLSWKFKVSYK